MRMLAYTCGAAAAPGTALRDLRAPRRFAPRGTGRHSPSEGARPRAAAASPASGRRSMRGHHRRPWGRTSQERAEPLPPAGPTSTPRRPPPSYRHVRHGAAPAPPLRVVREHRATQRSRMTSRLRRAGRRVCGDRVRGSSHPLSYLAGAARVLWSSGRVVRWCRVVRVGTDFPRESPGPAAGIHSGSLQHFSLLPGHVLRVREACRCPVLTGDSEANPAHLGREGSFPGA